MPAHSLKVNLLPPSEFEQSFWGRFLKWAVTTGRYIIILTELVVIVAFLSRFKLDEDLRNLNEQIESQVGFLESQQVQVQEFLMVQKKADLVDKELAAQPGIVKMIDYLASRKPEDVLMKERIFSAGLITFSANTLNEKALGTMITEMNRDGRWKSLDLTQITSDQKTGITFTLTATK